MFASGHITGLRAKAVAFGVGLAVLALLAGACSSSAPESSTTNSAPTAVVSTPAPEPTVADAASTLPTAVPTVAPTPTPTVVPTPTTIPAADDTEDRQAFCTFMSTRYFWEPGLDDEFLALMPDGAPSSVLRPFRARAVLDVPGLGDPRENSLATKVLFTAFASDLGRYLEIECPGFGWIETAVAHTGDPDFVPMPDPMVPSSDLDLCASLQALEAELEGERDRRGPVRLETAEAAQVFAAAIDPDAPFEVLAFSHLVLTQATLSFNRVTFELYLGVAFENLDLVDEEAVAVYFDEACPAVRDTRLWLTPPRAAGAIPRPVEGEGLPDGWETVPPEDIRSSFGGDLRTLPVGDFTPLLTSYPPFDYDGVEFTSMGTSWVTESTDPAQALFFVGWLYDGDEPPFEVPQATVVGPDGTRYQADIERSFVQPGFVELVFVLDFIPENLQGVGFGIVPN